MKCLKQAAKRIVTAGLTLCLLLLTVLFDARRRRAAAQV